MSKARPTLSAWSAVAALAGFGACGLSFRQPPTILLIGGDIQGYLSPCGCSSPMTGGIRRLASAVRAQRGNHGVFVENGGIVPIDPPNGVVGQRENRLKLETAADALRSMGVDALNVGEEEAAEGPGAISELVELTEGRVVSTSLEPGSAGIKPWIARGPFLIGGITPAVEHLASVTGERPVQEAAAAAALVAEARRSGLAAVLLYRGVRTDAEALARTQPGLRLIVYRGSGAAPAQAETVGSTTLVCPGDKSQDLVRLSYDGSRFFGYAVSTLTPNFADDPAVSRIYLDGYLTRVARAALIEQLPRAKTAAFAGSNACRSCHREAYAIWHRSAHANALHDLERQHQDRDPDCLGCHVTGLASLAGFRTRSTTPLLANVTCEACHGPARSHAQAPTRVRLPKLGSASCIGCHSVDNSPNFNFKSYWPKVSHR